MIEKCENCQYIGSRKPNETEKEYIIKGQVYYCKKFEQILLEFPSEIRLLNGLLNKEMLINPEFLHCESFKPQNSKP